MQGDSLMKLAILHQGNLIDISLGGIDRYVKSIIANSTDDITVYGICHSIEDIGKCITKSINGKFFNFIPICTDDRSPLSLYYTLSLFKYIRQIEENDFFYLQRIEFALAFWNRKSRNRAAQIIHGSGKYYEISYGKKRFFLHSVLERLSIGITNKTFIIMNNNEYGVPFYKMKYPKYAHKFHFALNAIDTNVYCRQNMEEARSETGLNQYKYIAIYTGRIIDNPKRILLIPDICKKITSSESFLFVIIGDGPDMQKLKDKVSNSHLDDKFLFTGYIEDNHILAKYYNASDVAINISMYEGTCTSNIESVACGTPLVSTDVGEIRELIQDNKNGIIIANDADTIACEGARAIERIWYEGMTMSDTYLKYDGSRAIAKLRKDLINNA